ncbi:MAG: cytochrome C [Hyphomicrobiaceae bacterium TMED74]|nr:MAG: cytochrome C [Hyphomicrobiaceae bacterium TMED74]
MGHPIRSVRILMSFLAFAVALLLAGEAFSANLGNRDRGLAFAQQNCASCHAVMPKQHLSPLKAATPFQTISEVGGMTAIALRVLFQTPHKTMPNLILADEDKDDVIAYILSLRPQQ